MDIVLAILLSGFVLVYVPIPVVLKLVVLSNVVLTLAALRIGAGSWAWVRSLRFLIAGALALILVLGLLQYEVPAPGLYIFLLLLSVAVFGATLFQDSLRAAFVSVAAVLASLALIEAHASGRLSWQSAVAETRYLPDGNGWREAYVSDVAVDPELGYVNRPNLKTRQVRSTDGRTIYDATYTTDAQGNRVTGFERKQASKGIVFLGDSFVFGQGVDDRDTLPSVVGQSLPSDNVSIHNLGVVGWGIHQVVALLEGDRLTEKAGRSAIQFGVYVAIFDHVRRAMGLATWVGTGPRYALASDDKDVVRSGRFGQGVAGHSLNALKRFGTFNAYIAPLLIGDKQYDLYAALVAKAAAEFNRRHGGQLVVLYWPVPATKAFDREIVARLKQRGVQVVAVDEIVPDFWTAHERYQFRGDEHPTAFAYAKVGSFLANMFSPQLTRPPN